MTIEKKAWTIGTNIKNDSNFYKTRKLVKKSLPIHGKKGRIEMGNSKSMHVNGKHARKTKNRN